MRRLSGRRIHRFREGERPVKQADGSFILRIDNIPGVPPEEMAPPEDALTTQIDFFYPVGNIANAGIFWVSQYRGVAEALDAKLGPPKAARRILEATVAESDSPEVKLKKLYDRAQTFAYLEAERHTHGNAEEWKPAKDVPELLKHGYGSGRITNLLFIALARAAGFEAAPVMVADRETTFFRPNLMDPHQLSSMVVRVQAGSKEYFLHPSMRYCPFGILPWGETASAGYRIDKPLAVYTTTPAPQSSDASIERKASLQLDEAGGLHGQVHLTFSGQEALLRRSSGSDLDEEARRKLLVAELKSWLPGGSSVELTQVNKWEQSTELVRVDFTISVPSYGTSTGRRLMLPVGLFHGNDPRIFQSSKRVLPVYFPYPYSHTDEVTIQVPDGMAIESLPKPSSHSSAAGSYETSCKNSGNTVTLTRKLTREGLVYRADQYGQLRSFYSGVRTGDEGQFVLRSSTSTNLN